MSPVQIVELWGRILKILRAATALRDLARMVEVIIEHVPAMRPEGPVKEALSDWTRITLLYLGPITPDKLEAESTLSAVEYQLLCRNRNGVVSLPPFLDISVVCVCECVCVCVCWSHAKLRGKSVNDGTQIRCFMAINICTNGHQQYHQDQQLT